MDRERWFDRTFDFDLPLSLAPNVVERLRGTPARVEELTRAVSPRRMTARIGDRWSAQENVGHLVDLEPLWIVRVEEIAAGRTRLSAADLQNRATAEANHNARELAAILAELRAARGRLVGALEAMDPGLWGATSLHPRLESPMRMIDLGFFVAEHDDHHLATITAILRDPANAA